MDFDGLRTTMSSNGIMHSSSCSTLKSYNELSRDELTEPSASFIRGAFRDTRMSSFVGDALATTAMSSSSSSSSSAFLSNEGINSSKGASSSSTRSSERKDDDAPAVIARERRTTKETKSGSTQLRSVQEIDKMFPIAANIAFAMYMALLLIVYGCTPREEWEYLPQGERDAAALAFYVLSVASLLIFIPVYFQRPVAGRLNTTRGKTTSVTPSPLTTLRLSGIVYAALVVHLCAILTNAILAFCPTVVKFDRYTQSRVFLVRWCEWIPLSGLMTFLSEAVDTPRTERGLQIAIAASLCQTLSCVAGIVFPFCDHIVTWLLVMTYAIVTWLPIYPRVYIKYQNLIRAPVGKSFIESENRERLRFSYELLFICSIVWGALVFMYFYNQVIHCLCDETHILRSESLAMKVDTLFDVIAKALYMNVIVEVHCRVFDPEGRAHRQLDELRSLMTVLWDTSSDVIVISVKHEDKVTSMLSPSFPNLIGASLPDNLIGRKATALFLAMYRQGHGARNPQGDDEQETLSKGGDNAFSIHVNASSYVDSSEIPYGGVLRDAMLSEVDMDSPVTTKASSLVSAAWSVVESQQPGETNFPVDNDSTSSSSPLSLYSLINVDGTECKCELRVSSDDNTMIAVVRDVTERYRRFEAERRIHMEALARQKESQSQTRFVRHEVKNGLLAGIELCDSLRNAVYDFEKLELDGIKSADAVSAATSTLSATLDAIPETICPKNRTKCTQDGRACAMSATKRRIEELDVTLHEVLDTVLAEAMARDVIHEVYQPRLERLDVKGLLSSSGSIAGNAERFPIKLRQHELPYLQLDPQLLRYIHRNAMSNACKYGKQGGQVITWLSFCPKNNEFEMQVINEPGIGHEQIMKLGDTGREAVFAQDSSLHKDFDHVDKYISSGDGAWIMQKCAKTMKGHCTITFETARTVFSFRCPSKPLIVSDLPDSKDFAVPTDTWGIAVDDSKIQRKLMSRLISHAGVDDSRKLVLGEKPSDIHELQTVMSKLLDENPTSKVLMLMDENLDYGESEDDNVVLSGSAVLKDILALLPPEQESRVLALVRSANDSADDVALYLSRTHGFFPKAPMQKERVLEILAPLWADRFLAPKTSSAVGSAQLDFNDGDSVDKEELLFSVEFVDSLVRDCLSRDVPWIKIRSALHSLKGDLMILESSPVLDEIVSLIGTMNGLTYPVDFINEWQRIHRLIRDILLTGRV